MSNIKIQNVGTTYKYSSVMPDDLDETMYTVVTIVRDVSGSVAGFRRDLDNAIIAAIDACKLSQNKNNLLVRVVDFNHNIQEIHGFAVVTNINNYNIYKCNPGGLTALFRASHEALCVTEDYVKTLYNNGIITNGIIIVLTDGMNEDSTSLTPYDIAKKKQEIVSDETNRIDSLVTMLVGLNTKNVSVSKYLEEFKNKAGFDSFIKVEDATPESLAKLANIISKSISTQSQNINTGNSVQVASLTI